MRRRAFCPCSRDSAIATDDERRRAGWRLVPATTAPSGSALEQLLTGDVFVWLCPECVVARNVQLRAG